MNEIDRYVDLLFAGQPTAPETDEARAVVTAQLSDAVQALCSQGMERQQALSEAFVHFGAGAGVREALAQARTGSARSRFRRYYPHLVRSGIAALIILPIIAALLCRSIHQKLIVLMWWTIGVILLMGFVIAMEYLDHRWRLQPPPPEPNLPPLAQLLCPPSDEEPQEETTT